MREFKDFNTEKKIYIGKVLNHIHYEKLHARIYDELSDHLDDMYEDFSNTYDNEPEITRKVIDGMGNPDDLGKELQKIHKSVLLRARIRKAIISVIAYLLCPFIVYGVGGEVSNFFDSASVENVENELSEFGEVNLLTEVEHEGIVHRFYVPESQDEDSAFMVYHTYSIKLFGFNLKSRFKIDHGSYYISDSYAIVDLNPDNLKLCDTLFIYFDDPEEEYMKIKYIPTEDNKKEVKSDFIEVPQNATADKPEYLLLDCPDGYRWKTLEKYDGDKNQIGDFNIYQN